jgi:hypothetical protein
MSNNDLKSSLSKELENTESEINSYKLSKDDVSVGGIFNPKTFNEKLNKLNELKRKRSKLKDQIKLSKMTSQMTTNQLLTNQLLTNQLLTKEVIINDIYKMVDEFKNLEKINIANIDGIIKKGYRKLIILIALLVILIVIYVSI